MKRYFLLTTILICSHIANAQLCFNNPISFLTSSDPFDLCAADFNRDGKIDIATANIGGTNIVILLGDGAGNLGPPTNFGGLIGYVNAIITADFNGDTIPDLAATNYYNTNNKVSVLLGDGFGNFGAPNNISVVFNSQPTALVSADFNLDGNADIATANKGSHNISIFLGNGSGTFGAQSLVSAGLQNFAAINSIVSDDFNSDSIPDLAVATINASGGFNGVQVLIGNGIGGFATASNFSTFSKPFSIITNDFNGDTFADLATVSSNSNTGHSIISVLLGNGAGSFGIADTFVVASNSYTSSLISADLNGDSIIDLIAGNNGVGNLSVLLGTGTGSFGTPTTFTSGYGTYDMLSSDFNGDGKKDLAIGNQNSQNKVTILLNCSLPNGITKIKTSNQPLIVYPNPATNSIFISNIFNKTIFRIYDSLGRLLIEKTSEIETEIDISNLPQGVYTLLTKNQNTEYHKIIIAR
jgi:hypothetical protein